jgi:hypothetical protein
MSFLCWKVSPGRKEVAAAYELAAAAELRQRQVSWEREKKLPRKILRGPKFVFLSYSWETLGDDLFFLSQYLLGSCQTTKFGEEKMRYCWRCSYRDSPIWIELARV